MSERPRSGISLGAVGRIKASANKLRSKLTTRREAEGKTGERYTTGVTLVKSSRRSFAALKSGGSSAFNSVKGLFNSNKRRSSR